VSTPPDQPMGQPYAPQPVSAAPRRRRSPWLWIGLGCGGLIILSICGFTAASFGLLAAIVGSPTATPFVVGGGTAVPAQGGAASGQGQTVSIKNWDITVTGVERPGKELVWSQFGNKSTAVGTWVVVAVKMKNTGNQNFGVNTFDFEMRASGGTKYNVSTEGLSYSTFKGGQSVGGQVPPGSEVTYYIPFDITPSATELLFVFKQDKNPAFAIGNATP
jgi:hypothetical protein